MTRQARLCHAVDIADDTSRGFDPGATGRDTVFVVRSGGCVRAWRNACPHWGDTPMAWCKDAYLSGDARHIMCSAHGALFDLESGVCTLGPCQGKSLARVPLIYLDDGSIAVTVDELMETIK